MKKRKVELQNFTITGDTACSSTKNHAPDLGMYLSNVVILKIISQAIEPVQSYN